MTSSAALKNRNLCKWREELQLKEITQEKWAEFKGLIVVLVSEPIEH